VPAAREWLARGTRESLDSDMAELAAWDSFYLIVGSAAGALIGLQFVVMTLVAATSQNAAEAGAAFATPTRSRCSSSRDHHWRN
jgi:hypothetical protein